MNDCRFGIWLIGAWGRAATTFAVRLLALHHSLDDKADLVSERPEFSRLDLADWNCFGTIGGHEIRRTSFLVEAGHLFGRTSDCPNRFSSERLAAIGPELEAFDKNVRTGTLIHCGAEIESRATTAALKTRGESPRIAIERIIADLAQFATANALAHVLVVNLASPESPPQLFGDDHSRADWTWPELADILEKAGRSPVPASTLYAIAALKSGCSYVNFTASIGSDLPALRELAETSRTLHMGRGGIGDSCLLLAAQVLDVVRFCEREHRRGKSGVMTQLISFFENPMRAKGLGLCPESDRLDCWSDEVASEA